MTTDSGSWSNYDQKDAVSCVPDCSGMNCGDDGCGGSCGSCQGSMVCSPIQVCAAPTTAGETAVLSSSYANYASVTADRVELSATSTIKSLSLYIGWLPGKQRIGIYDASGSDGGPGNLLAQTAEFDASTGWNTVDVTSPVVVPAGTYWLAWGGGPYGQTARMTTSSGTYRKASWNVVSKGKMPPVFPAGSNQTGHHSLYVMTIR
jgi:hypothetical protein